MTIDKEGRCICEIMGCFGRTEILALPCYVPRNWQCSIIVYSHLHTLGRHPPGSSKLNVKHCQRAMCRITEQVQSYCSGRVQISWAGGPPGPLVFWPRQAMGAAQLFGS